MNAKAYCVECGRPVRMVRNRDGGWEHGRCQWHQFALRMPQGFVDRAFEAMKAAVEAAPDISQWRVQPGGAKISTLLHTAKIRPSM